MTNEEVDVHNLGRRAVMAFQFLSPIIEKRRETIIAQLKNAFRSGQTSQAEMTSFTASLCTLDDLVADIKSTIRRGDKIAEKING